MSGWKYRDINMQEETVKRGLIEWLMSIMKDVSRKLSPVVNLRNMVFISRQLHSEKTATHTTYKVHLCNKMIAACHITPSFLY